VSFVFLVGGYFFPRRTRRTRNFFYLFLTFLWSAVACHCRNILDRDFHETCLR